MTSYKKMIHKIPGVKNIMHRFSKIRQAKLFKGTTSYWEQRYAKGGNSGWGAYGELANYKAEVLNAFVKENNIATVMEFGCGDGNQLSLSVYPSYIGLDVSVSAIQKCMRLFKNDNTKSFALYSSLAFCDNHHLLNVELALSLDVVYHLVELEVYEAYLDHLFNASKKYVIIYAWDFDGKKSPHVFHRKFTRWIEENKKDWLLLKVNTDIPKYPKSCDFFIYKKKNA